MIFFKWVTLSIVAGFLVLGTGRGVLAGSRPEAVWQWSVPTGEGRAFLWIPERCARVRAFVLAQHTMIERGILEDPTFRRTLADLDMAAVFLAPGIDPVYDFGRGAVERFAEILGALAEESGYAGIATAPVVPMGHSAHASFSWNFAARHPDRTLAVLSLKGDAPLSELTGSGRPNPAWGDRSLDGIPGLFVMSEGEWWEARFEPLLRFRADNPAAPLAALADVGRGHFDAGPPLVEFLSLFLRKAAEARLPRDGSDRLRVVDPVQGWLIDRWRGEEPPRAPAAPSAVFAGDRAEALWCFDAEMARAVERYQANTRGRTRQQVSFVQEGEFVPIANTHGEIELRFLPESDGITFRLEAGFVVPLPPPRRVATKDPRPVRWVVHPEPAAPGTHAAGPVRLSVLAGPAEAIGPETFRVALDRLYSPRDTRTGDVWLLAEHPGDAHHKGAVQQALVRLPRHGDGLVQTITFEALPDQRSGAATVPLAAHSDAALPVSFFVREGPAFVRDGVLHLVPLPPGARFPVQVTVVAWQFGRGASPKVQAAAAVSRSFQIVP